MGNAATRNFEKWGNGLLQTALQQQWRGTATARSTRRLEFFGTELKETRQTYNNYLLGVSEFKQAYKEGMLGRDVAGFALATGTLFLFFHLGKSLGRGSASPLSTPAHKYPPVDGAAPSKHH